MAVSTPSHPAVLGYARVRRTGRRLFPIWVVDQSGVALAELGRWSWLNIYLGPGQRIDVADGARWRLGAINRRQAVCPAVRDRDGSLLAYAAPIAEHQSGIATPQASYTLYPAEATTWRRRSDRWRLAAWGDDIGELTRRPHSVVVERRVSLAAILVAFAVAELGIPGEADLGMPRFQWRGT